ncbi:MAG TPA: nickel transporter permease [Thermomicrobiaceae bacterium]|nr:nickel transporter permease [Thermomicrobiaceae bacterium]
MREKPDVATGYVTPEAGGSVLARSYQITPRWIEFLRRFRRSKAAIVGLVLLVLLILSAIFAPTIAPFDPNAVNPTSALYSPGFPYLFGTDQYGRDVLSRVIFGSRISLVIGLISVGIAAVFGVTIGLVSGYYARWVDSVLMRVVDIMLAFPGILLALAIVSMLGPSITNLMIAVGISSIPVYARLTRGSVLSARESLYVDAARTIGVPNRLILRRHLLPNVVTPIIVAGTLGVGAAILVAASLSFLGLGAQPPTPEWGSMLSEGRAYLEYQWWIATFPGLAIMVTVLATNMLGDGLRDTLDPRLKD